ncbi:MAG TPA: membrane protein insertase YidC, partial [Burkholderiaceae bacterium]
MTDMRRTVLWVVFSLSLVLLWDGWQKYNGHPSMFAPAPHAAAPATPGSAPGSAPAGLPAAATAAASAPEGGAAPALVSELVNISTDLFKATLDTRGGSLVHVELLKQIDKDAPGGHVVVLDTSAERYYQAQTGLTGVPGAPSHLSVMRLVSTERALAEGANALTLRFESAEEGGLKLVKTYTFKRGEYA